MTETEQCASSKAALNVGSVEALSLYRSTGWVEVAAFNDEPFADHWLEKALT